MSGSLFSNLMDVDEEESPAEDFTKVPARLDAAFTRYSYDGALKPTLLKVGGNGSRMPMTDPPRPMDAAQLELFERWIAQGAKNN